MKDAIKKNRVVRALAGLLGMAPKPSRGRTFLLELLPRQSVGAEIGVHLGDFSDQILQTLRTKQLHLIDPWEHQSAPAYKEAWFGGGATGGQREMDERYEGVCRRFASQVAAGNVVIHRAYSTDALSKLDDACLDWVYIDGNHLYEYVKADLELSLRKTKPGGFITGDDYIEGGWWQGGVKKAVDEFSKRDSVELVEIRNEQFVFRKV